MKKKKKKEPVLEPRPLLTEMVIGFSKLAGPMSRKDFNWAFYQMSLESTAPECVKRLTWDWSGGNPESYDLMHMVMFINAIQKELNA